MSSKAFTEKREDGSPGFRWQAPAEMSPSVTRDTQPLLPRLAGVVGLVSLVFGGVVILVHASGRPIGIGAGWGTIAGLLGICCLLFHAANEADFQLRRAYMFFGYLWLLFGAGISLIPYKGPVGANFLPLGATFLFLGLCFLLAYLRQELDPKLKEIAGYVLGGIGSFLAISGFIGSNGPETFLFSHGVMMILLGAVFLWAFVSIRGIADDLGYTGALVVGGVGLLATLVAAGRSGIPPLLLKFGLVESASYYFMPHGIVLLGVGLLYVVLAAGLVSDNSLVVMARRQLGSYFLSPIAYFMLLLFSLVAAFQFFYFVAGELLEPLTLRGAPGTLALTVATVPEPIVRRYLVDLVPVFCVVFAVPVLTMNLLSEEQRSGTLEMTLTTPQEESTLVLSKFLAALFMFVLTWAPFGIFLISLRVGAGEPFDYQPFLAWMVALIFTGAGFVAMGLFFSSLTKNQLTAAVLTFVAMLKFVALFLIKQRALRETDLWHTVCSRVSFIDVWWQSLSGKLGPSDLVYHLSVSVFWLFLTVKVLESRKWR